MKKSAIYATLVLGITPLFPGLAMEEMEISSQRRIIHINGPYHITSENAQERENLLRSSVDLIVNGEVAVESDVVVNARRNLSITCTTLTNNGKISTNCHEE